MSQQPKARRRPPISIIASEADTLTDLALTIQDSSPLVSELLLAELERAKLCTEKTIPSDVVTMHSTVEFLDERSGQRRTVQLVYPSAADAEQHKISILTPIGAGLIGMRAGASIAWPDRSGAERPIQILSVQQPARTEA